MSHRSMKILWALLISIGGTMTALAWFALTMQQWPAGASPIAIACSMITGWALVVSRGRFDDGWANARSSEENESRSRLRKSK